MGAIEVHVRQGGRIVGGELRADAQTVARCTVCNRDTDAVAAIGDGAFACAPCLRERLDALSVACFRLRESRTGALPWGKVSG
jgi:hypothetical protein